MAKVKLPLMSLAAKGSLCNGALTFSSHHWQTRAIYTPKWKKNDNQRAYPNTYLFTDAQKFWNLLPDYAKDSWFSTSRTQPHGNNNSPWRAPIKGRPLFFRQACLRIKNGKRPKMSPYSGDLACIVWPLEPHIYASE